MKSCAMNEPSARISTTNPLRFQSNILSLVATMLGLLAGIADAGFVKVENRGKDGWCFVQDGKPFFSMGATTVMPIDWPPKDRENRGYYDGVAAQGGEEQWLKVFTGRMNEWGFNSLGAWAKPEVQQKSGLLYTQMISFGGWHGNRLTDVFSPEFAEGIEATAKEQVAPLANDQKLIGYFTGNELNWFGEFGWPTGNDNTLFDVYLALSAGAPGKIRLLDWLEEYFRGNFDEFKEAFQTDAADWNGIRTVTKLSANRFRMAQQAKYAWAGVVAERYFALCEDAIRRHDKNHLILGCRLTGANILSVVKAQGRHCDVVSINRYDKNGVVAVDFFDQVHAMTGKPIIVSEYSWRATENRSGLKNTRGADVTVPTQLDRATRADQYVRGFMARPYALGMHWFQYHDEPTNGRFDGEDSNYGLVDLKDKPYEELAAVFTKLAGELKPGSWQRTDPPHESARRGWAEFAPLAIAEGGLSQPVNLLPSANDRERAIMVLDSAHGATMTLNPDDKGGWTGQYDSGTGWGLSPTFYVADSSLAGGKKVRVRFQAPKDTLWRVILSEHGEAPDYAGQFGSDGETFGSEHFRATGDVEERTLHLEDFVVRWEWGNQKGNRTIDLNGLGAVAIALPESNKKGEFRILSVELVP